MGEETSFPSIAATDFFSAEVLTRTGLVRYFVLFVIDLKTRRVEIAGILPRPDGEWMSQVARNLTDCEDGFQNGSRHLIHYRDPLFTRSFRAILKTSGVETVKLPPRCPKPECLRGEVRSLHQVRMPGPDHPIGRATSTPRCKGIHEALPRRAQSSGTRQSADRGTIRRGRYEFRRHSP